MGKSKELRIVSYNVNGIRAAIKKGLIDWLKTDPADIVCLQEVKAQETDIDKKVFEDLGFHIYWYSAEKKGYSGVAILSKLKAESVKYGNGQPMSDSEGRVIEIKVAGFTIINAYFPSGTSGELRQGYKYIWLNEMSEYLLQKQQTSEKILLCGDYNIAHTEIDIHDPKGNKKSSGFLPEERAWFTQFIQNGWVDTFRHFNTEPHRYSWWSQRNPSVRANNKGWRIDYILATVNAMDALVSADILHDVVHSDHCPVFVSIKK